MSLSIFFLKIEILIWEKKNFIYICQNYEQPLFLYQSSRAAQNFFFYVIPSFFFVFVFSAELAKKSAYFQWDTVRCGQDQVGF